MLQTKRDEEIEGWTRADLNPHGSEMTLWGCQGGIKREGENNKLSYASYSRVVGDERGNQEHTCHTWTILILQST